MSVFDEQRDFPEPLASDADAGHATVLAGIEALRALRFDPWGAPDPRSGDEWAETTADRP